MGLNHIKRFISFWILVCMVSTMSYAKPSNEEYSNDTAWVKFGETASRHLVKEAKMGQTEKITLVDRNDKTGWYLNSANMTSAYINIDLAESFANCNDDGTEYEVEVEYLAPSKALFNIEYDSVSKINRETDITYLSGEQTWQTEKIILDDAYFGNRLDGYDLRVGVRSDKINRSSGNLIISQIRITKHPKKNPVQVTEIKTSELGNIFGNGEDKSFDVRLKNYSEDQKRFVAEYKAINDFGDVVWTKNEELVFEPKEEQVRKITVDATRYCLYEFVVTINGEGYSHSIEVPFSFVNTDEENRKNNSCGYNVHFTWKNYDPFEGVEVLQKSNAGFIRCNLPWLDIDPVKERKHTFILPQEYQNIVDALNGSGIKWQFLLAYGNTKYGLEAYNAMPKTEEQVEGFVKYAEFITNYLKENNVDIHSYEIWNEPNLKTFNVTEEPASVYANLADKTAEAMRKLNPTAEISVLSQAQMATEAGQKWAKEVLGSVNLDNMDAISVHPYNHGNMPEKGLVDTIDIYKQMYVDETEREPKVHISELGYYCYSTRMYTSLTQAEYNVRSYVYMHGMKLGSSFAFYDLSRDGAIDTYTEHNFGSVESSNPEVTDVPYAAKEYFLAIANMNKVLRNAEISKYVLNDGERYAFMFNREDDNKNVIALWTAGQPEYKTFRLNANEVTLYDIFGNSQKVHGKDGLFTFNMTNSMSYIEGDFTDATIVDTKYTPSVADLEIVCGDNHNIVLDELDIDSETIETSTTLGLEAVGEGNIVKLKSTSVDERTDFLVINVNRDGKTIHSYKITVKSKKPLSTSIYAFPSGGKDDIFRWKGQLLIENHSINEPISGTVTIKSPAVFANNMRSVRFGIIPAKTIGDITLNLPRLKNLDMYDVTYVVETDDGYKEEFTQKVDFTMALYTDKKPTIDGVMEKGEWDRKSSLTLNKEEQVYLRGGYNWKGTSDHSAVTTIMYDDENLYMFVEAKDDVHYATNSGATTWNDDSIQFGIAFEKKAHDAMVGGTFTEINLSDTPNGPEVYRSVAENNELPRALLPTAELVIKRIGDVTYYEASIPWSEITIKDIDFDNVEKIGFSMLINDNDGEGRKGWIEYASGIGLSKDIDLFTFLCTVK